MSTGLRAWIVERARGQRRTLPQPYPITTLEAARTQAMALLSGTAPWDRPKTERVLTLRGFLRDAYGPWVQAERKSGKATVARVASAFAGFLDKPIAGLTTWADFVRFKTRSLGFGVLIVENMATVVLGSVPTSAGSGNVRPTVSRPHRADPDPVQQPCDF